MTDVPLAGRDMQVTTRRRRRRGSVVTVLAAAILMLAMTASPAYAIGVTVSLTNPLTVTNRLLITATVTVVCDPLPGEFTFFDFAAVQVSQADGQAINSGSGFSGQLLTCDGVTVNRVPMTITPNPGSGPFHSGPAIAIATATHSTGDSCGPGCIFNTQQEDGTTGWIPVKLRS